MNIEVHRMHGKLCEFIIMEGVSNCVYCQEVGEADEAKDLIIELERAIVEIRHIMKEQRQCIL